MLAELLGTPGASKTVLEAVVPYSEPALADLLGRAPEQACSEATARSLAMAAFQRGRSLRPGNANVFGLACTASLATDRRKRGEHRAYIALQTETATHSVHLQLKGDRASEEQTLVEVLWHTMSRSLELDLQAPAPEMFESEFTQALTHSLTYSLTYGEKHWRELILDEASAHATQGHDGKLLFPGAFNPLHHAHERMLEIAESRTGLSGAYELSITNVDKPALDYTEIESRLRQFKTPVWLTRLPTFLDKARQFPGAHFVVGTDTVTRINDAKYYPSPSARDEALAELADLGSRFVVFGRKDGGSFRTLSALSLPDGFRSRCIEISEAEFHEPISSTELRGQS